METLGRYHLNQVVKVNILSNEKCQHHVPPDVMLSEGYNVSYFIFLTKMNLNIRQYRNILQNNWPVVFKSVRVMNNKTE